MDCNHFLARGKTTFKIAIFYLKTTRHIIYLIRFTINRRFLHYFISSGFLNNLRSHYCSYLKHKSNLFSKPYLKIVNYSHQAYILASIKLDAWMLKLMESAMQLKYSVRNSSKQNLSQDALISNSVCITGSIHPLGSRKHLKQSVLINTRQMYFGMYAEKEKSRE